MQQQVQCIRRWRFTVDICLARGEPLYKKSMSAPMNKWWADEDLLQLLLNLHINETFEMAQFIGKKWTLSLIMAATVLSVWTLWITGEAGVVIFTHRGYCLVPIEARHYCTCCIALSVLIHTGLELHWFGLFSSRGCWAPTKDQCDGVLKWAEF